MVDQGSFYDKGRVIASSPGLTVIEVDLPPVDEAVVFNASSTVETYALDAPPLPRDAEDTNKTIIYLHTYPWPSNNTEEQSA
jgi:hypothetical protein